MRIPRVAALSSHFFFLLSIRLQAYLEECTHRRLVVMPMPMMELLRRGQELRPMLDIRLMVTCPQCTVHTRCTSHAIHDIYRP